MRDGLRPHNRIIYALQFELAVYYLRVLTKKGLKSHRVRPFVKQDVVRLDICSRKSKREYAMAS